MQLPADLPTERGTVLSPDGTALGYVRLGAGAPLVVCHGSFSSAQEWVPFAAQMARTRSVYLYDRRGRGSSPFKAVEFAIDAEVDDLAAMVERAGPDAAVLGHSFGGGCALSLAARGRVSGPLILYEPRHSVRRPLSRGHIPELERLLAAGDRNVGTQFFLSHIVGMPAQAVDAARRSPAWETMCRTLDTLPNELRFLDSLTWRPGDLDGVAGAPTLLIGEQSPVLPEDASPDAALRSLLPALRTVSIPGQGHFAYIAAPALLAEVVHQCLRGADA